MTPLLGLAVVIGTVLLLSGTASAHCPLCTAGAGIAATGAAYLGVDMTVIGLFLGAFAVSTGWWAARTLSTRYIPYQTAVIVVTSLALTVLPLGHIINRPFAYHVGIMGKYGTLLNSTYTINLALITAVIGGGVVAVSPTLSRQLTELRDGRHVRFQGIALTFALLIMTGTVLQVI